MLLSVAKLPEVLTTFARFCPKKLMRFGDGKFDEEKRQQGENGGLEEADKSLKQHKGHWREVGQKERRDSYQDLSSENVTEEPEGKRDDTNEVSNEFDETDRKTRPRVKIEKFPRIICGAKHGNARYFDHEE